MWRRVRYLVLLLGLCAIATCPAAKRSCTAKIRTAEADQLLGYLAERVAAQVAATGRVPPTAAGPSPDTGCCARGGLCPADTAAWQGAGWRELGFSIDSEHRFTYQYIPDPSGLGATLRAVGDVACDGTTTAVELQLTVTSGALTRQWSRKPAVR